MEKEGIIEQMREDIQSVIRNKLTEVGGEYDLTDNIYGFCSAWLDDGAVWWDKSAYAIKMDELT